jgi:hypothetical protein
MIFRLAEIIGIITLITIDAITSILAFIIGLKQRKLKKYLAFSFSTWIITIFILVICSIIKSIVSDSIVGNNNNSGFNVFFVFVVIFSILCGPILYEQYTHGKK